MAVFPLRGRLAQLVERLPSMQEAGGSNPSSSTFAAPHLSVLFCARSPVPVSCKRLSPRPASSLLPAPRHLALKDTCSTIRLSRHMQLPLAASLSIDFRIILFCSLPCMHSVLFIFSANRKECIWSVWCRSASQPASLLRRTLSLAPSHHCRHT